MADAKRYELILPIHYVEKLARFGYFTDFDSIASVPDIIAAIVDNGVRRVITT